jgi:hypothetical protein
MSIPVRLTTYLDQIGAHVEIRAHPHSHSSAETARTAHIPPHQLATGTSANCRRTESNRFRRRQPAPGGTDSGGIT